MRLVYLILMVLALACFLASSFGANPPRPSLLSLGLAFWSLAEIVRAAGPA